MRRLVVLRGLWVAAVALGLAGCGPFGSDAPAVAALAPVAGPGVRVQPEKGPVLTGIQGDRGYAAWIADGGIQVIGLDLATNTPTWSAHELGRASEISDLIVLPDAVVLTTRPAGRGTPGGGLIVLDPATGATRWMTDFEGDDPTFYADAVVLGPRTAKTTRGLDWKTGATLWSIPDAGDAHLVPVKTGADGPIADQRLFLLAADHVLRTYDVRTGKPTGTRTVHEAGTGGVVVGQTLVTTVAGNNVPGPRVLGYPVSGEGPVRNMHQVDGKRTISQVAACGTDRICLVEDGRDGVPELRAFDGSSGQQQWRAEAPKAARSPRVARAPIAMAGDRIVYAGSVFAPDGRVLHRGANPTDTGYASLGRVTDARLLGLSATIGRFPTSAVPTEVASVSSSDGARRVLGSVTASPGSCSWGERFLLCAGATSLGVYPLA
ncbi:PQQ-binding-like beta-propeller repeat protein [Longispora sp. K20-0274]|uniref:outer membrane protein assembly factor BamB family protein n=1 Tax=Longispora sp. K20-0274 TaxID=3088255 RepID=UPI00399C3CDA